MKPALLLSLLALLSACSRSLAPIEQVQHAQQQNPKLTASISKASTHVVERYQCEHHIQLTVERLRDQADNSAKKKDLAIIVTFNDFSYKLQPVASSNGRKYSNLRWEWTEFDDYAELIAINQRVLANHCQHVSSSTLADHEAYLSTQLLPRHP